MRIAFDLTSSAKREPGGISAYGRELVTAFRAVAGAAHEHVVAVRANRWPRRDLLADLAPGGRVRLLVDGLTGLLGSVDVLHGTGARLPRTGRFARVATIHDVNVFEFPELSAGAWRERRRARLRETVARADLVVALSAQGRAMIVEHLAMPPERVVVVPGGVDVERFAPPDAGTIARVHAAHDLEHVPYFVTLGRLGARKNQRGLVDAFARSGIDGGWSLVLVGPTADEGARLRAHAAAAGIAPERIRCLGRVPDGDVPALLAGSRGYVCASMHEGQGRPVIEAQACGAPVACSDRGALPETLGDCGFLFDPTDLDAFADALRRLAAGDAAVAELRARGPARARALYAWPRVVERLLDVYERARAARG